jgi:hypothetical protein
LDDEVLRCVSPSSTLAPEGTQIGYIQHLGLINPVYVYIGLYSSFQMRCGTTMDIYQRPVYKLGKNLDFLTKISTVVNYSKLVRWEVETVFDITTELALFSASIYLVKGLQLSLSKKVTVIFAFGLRLA